MSNVDPSVSPYEYISDWQDNNLVDGVRPVLFVDVLNTPVNPTGTFEPYAGMTLIYYLPGPDTGEEEAIENLVDSGIEISSTYTGSTISASGFDFYD
ncbi:hypothetical protein IW136_004138, partial [Coemansia sp. RSA 678]